MGQREEDGVLHLGWARFGGASQVPRNHLQRCWRWFYSDRFRGKRDHFRFRRNLPQGWSGNEGYARSVVSLVSFRLQRGTDSHRLLDQPTWEEPQPHCRRSGLLRPSVFLSIWFCAFLSRRTCLPERPPSLGISSSPPTESLLRWTTLTQSNLSPSNYLLESPKLTPTVSPLFAEVD